jgi:tetratricopeptide (TPR) repeat protein
MLKAPAKMSDAVRISACLITRNEQRLLPSCLQSLQGFVDEVVVVDTGSVDRTVEIAKDFGCIVLHRAWDGDFSAPRNLGLDKAKGDWILYIDADEELRVDQPLGALLSSSDNAAAARIKFHVHSERTPYAEHRLFRNDPRIRFKCVIHESVLPGILRVCGEDDRRMVDLFEVALIHHGYEGDQTHKHHRNLPILEEAILADPNRVYLRLHLGTILSDLEQPEAAAIQFRTGMDLAERPGVSSQMIVEGSLCAHGLCRVLAPQGDWNAVLKAADRGLRQHPGNLALHWTRARALSELGDAAGARKILMSQIAEDADTFFDPSLAYHKSLFGEDRFAFLAALSFEEGAFKEAAKWFDQAAKASSMKQEYVVKSTLARSRIKVES